MIDYSVQNKKAWEFNAYDFWVKEAGLPADRAKKIVADPRAASKRYADYRKYTISEIINAVIDAGFSFQRFDKHPSWTNPATPGEFTITAIK